MLKGVNFGDTSPKLHFTTAKYCPCHKKAVPLHAETCEAAHARSFK